MQMREKTQVMTAEDILRAVVRISHEILEQNHREIADLVVIGIKSRGDHLAHRIAENLERIEKTKVPVGVIDVRLYRDDVNLHDEDLKINRTNIPFEVTGKRVILVDEIIYTGRTIRAAMDAVMDFGRPAAIQLAVLIDRGHRELPIAADYAGKNIPTSRRESIRVQLVEEHGMDQAVIYEENS